jgi:hypothetical protein
MNKRFLLFVIVPAAFLFSACASVSFYSDSGLKHKTGIRVYTARPYILCDQSSGKDKVSVIWLPDLLNPRYLAIKQGFGSNELKIAIENGSLSSFGITTDSGIPDMLNSLASVVSKTASAVEMLGVPPLSSVTETAEVPFDLYELSVRNDSVTLRKINISSKNPF